VDGPIDISDYKIAVYIYVSGWWTKPTFANPITEMNPDGTWWCNIVTGGLDDQATRIAAFLIPSDYRPPRMEGHADLPSDLYQRAATHAIVERPCTLYKRSLEFANRTWYVKTSASPIGPGPNYFSDLPEDVWVDDSDRLHLRISAHGSRWYSTEVITSDPLGQGYGSYTFRLEGLPDPLDPNVVIGLFTWDDDAPEHHHREIDIEISHWGSINDPNAQYVVLPERPTPPPMIKHRFNIPQRDEATIHQFNWTLRAIDFASYFGDVFPPRPNDAIASWRYAGADNPPAGDGNTRINLWLIDGKPPANGQEVEVIVRSFDFDPQR